MKQTTSGQPSSLPNRHALCREKIEGTYFNIAKTQDIRVHNIRQLQYAGDSKGF